MDTRQSDGVTFTIHEQSAVPASGLLMGGAAMLPFVLLAVSIWVVPADGTARPVHWLVAWGSAILAFLAGVRRGLSFRTPGGERIAQIATVMWLFLLAFGALALAQLTSANAGGQARLTWSAAMALLLLGYASIALLDLDAARRQEVPLFFARLRPLQMLVPVASLAAACVRLWSNG